MSQSNAVARRVVEAGVSDPYDASNPENKLSVQTRQPVALALKDPIGQLLLGNQSEFLAIAEAAGVPAASMALELIGVARKKPSIRKCEPDSILTFMFDAAKLGLMIGVELDPVPVGHGKGSNRVMRLEAWPNYKGYRTLAIGSGVIRDAFSQVVFEGDNYEFSLTPVPHVAKHIPGPNFGKMQHAIEVYATGVYPGGRTRSIRLTRDQVMALRARNRGDTTANDSPWVQHEEAMWQAKAMKVLAKSIPQNKRLRALQEVEARYEVIGETPALPPAQATHPAEGDEGGDVPVLPPPSDAQPRPEPPPEAKLRAAHAVAIKFRSGQVRMLSEIRNDQLEKLLQVYRDRLQEDPENEQLVHQASAIAYVLEARADGRAREPHPQPEV
jgi:recombinational DNA repair protein RecT